MYMSIFSCVNIFLPGSFYFCNLFFRRWGWWRWRGSLVRKRLPSRKCYGSLWRVTPSSSYSKSFEVPKTIHIYIYFKTFFVLLLYCHVSSVNVQFWEKFACWWQEWYVAYSSYPPCVYSEIPFWGAEAESFTYSLLGRPGTWKAWYLNITHIC